MADDLPEADALCGEPGVYSARFGGAVAICVASCCWHACSRVPEALRTARFR